MADAISSSLLVVSVDQDIVRMYTPLDMLIPLIELVPKVKNDDLFRDPISTPVDQDFIYR